MAFRIVLVENEVSMKLKLNNLIITKAIEEEIWIPLSDISVIILDNLATTITARMLTALAEEGVCLVVCGMNHLPCGYFGPLVKHTRAAKMIESQINRRSTDFYELLWKEIVTSKVNNQRNVLSLINMSSDSVKKLENLIEQIQPGDSTNREAHAAKVTQLCGQNIRRKQFVINSLIKYFSNEKYMESEEQYRDNVYIDNEQVGRNYFKVIRILNIEDILKLINVGKATLLSQYIKDRLAAFDCENHLVHIENIPIEIFNIINNEMVKSIGDIAIDFSTSDLWEIVQKSKAYSRDGEAIELKSPFELLRIMINLIIKNTQNSAERIIIDIENMDHWLDIGEYKSFMNEMITYSDIYNIYIIVSTSLDGYVLVRDDVIEGITVFNSIDFTFPNVERLSTFINENYPYFRIFENDELLKYITPMVQRIGKEGYIIESVEMAICKIINDTLVEPEIRKDKENRAVTAFLNGYTMV
ncbi:MAG: type II CRISPR-associated endonuclease Cas1 [Lachnospiraceae bacterium]|nr:type II CRISPR-associated endonuclease Cas1 [Lachnospiraceae bacterium]